MPSYFRRPYGPGWALVGDAGYLKDPCTAQGITDAFHHAELLADALDDGLRGRRPFGDALARLRTAAQRGRHADVRVHLRPSALEPPTPQEEGLFAAMRDDPVLTGRFFGVFAGTVAVQDFFGAAVPSAAA